MDDQRQEYYRRKNWSSMILYNCGHPANAALTVEMVNHAAGGFLHAFSWLADGLIGGVPEKWNWLEGWSSPQMDPGIVHMTRGIPTMAGYETIPYADEWRSYLAVARR
jgi:hypothetical protein